MTQTKHTPTPWIIGEFDKLGGYDGMTAGLTVGPVTLDGAYYGQIAALDITDQDRARMEADAALIAATHDMLKALRDAERRLRFSGCWGGKTDMVAQAIARAEGRS